MKPSSSASCLFLALLLAAAQGSALARDVVIVNGQAISEASFAHYAQSRSQTPLSELETAERQELLEEMISRELIYQQALSQELDKEEEVRLELEHQHRNLLTNMLLDSVLQSEKPKDSDLEPIYREQVAKPASIEYKARHILVADEERARELIAELNKGADFAKLAEEHSTGPSAKEGGDLGWFAANQMVRPFGDAVSRLKPGSLTQRPVKTRFGWHVIKLEQTRKVKPPSLDQVRNQLLQVWENRRIGEIIEELRGKAEIKILP